MQTHVISHTHWDREWYLTYEQFRLRLVGLVDRLLDLMETRADFEFFHLDGQTIVLEDYLELRPHQEARLRKLIGEGRVLIGPWYDMPDEFLVSGESLVRNLALGHRIAARFGTAMPVGYLPDLFGHVAQMPQILRHFGLDNAILWRGFGGPRAEYWWQSPDGSRVLMMHLPPEGYCNATRIHLDPDLMIERATRAIEVEARRTAVGEVLLMNGVDHVEPHPVIPELTRQLTTALGSPVRHSTLPRYVDAVRAAVNHDGVGTTLEVVHGELRGGEEYANLLPGVFSARTYIKQANARVQTLLEKRAEPLATFAWMIGAPYPADELRYAWKTLLQNHPHDSICGCSIDAVHEENMTRFARAEQVARAIVEQAADAIARATPAAPARFIRAVAINTTGHDFDGVIEATIDVPYESAEPRRHVDRLALDAPVTFFARTARVASVVSHEGGALPFQVLDEEDVLTFVMMRHDTPWGVRAKRIRLLVPGRVPACGYITFDVQIAETTAAAPAHSPGISPLVVEPRAAENAHIRVTVNDDGTVDVVDKRSGAEYARCGELEDVGDVGDEYNYSPPPSDRRLTSKDLVDVTITLLHEGPLRVAFRIDANLPLPAAIASDRRRRDDRTVINAVSIVVAIDAGSPRVSWTVEVENHAEDHRLRLLFPVGAESVTDVRAESAFGVARRPARREAPASSRWEVPVSYAPTGAFTEAGSERAGAILFGEGLSEYEAVADELGRTSRLGLTLLRCVGYLSREDLVLRPSGHAGPGLATPGAQCPGRHTFRLAFEPRQEPPSNAALFERAASFTAPPHVVQATGTAVSLSQVGAFLTMHATTGAVVLSALHVSAGGDGMLVRLFNPDATPASVRLGTRRPVRHAREVDFLDRPQRDLSVDDAKVAVDVAPHRIITMQLIS